MIVFASYWYKKRIAEGVGNIICEVETNGCEIDEVVRNLESEIAEDIKAKKVILANFTVLEGD